MSFKFTLAQGAFGGAYDGDLAILLMNFFRGLNGVEFGNFGLGKDYVV